MHICKWLVFLPGIKWVHFTSILLQGIVKIPHVSNPGKVWSCSPQTSKQNTLIPCFLSCKEYRLSWIFDARSLLLDVCSHQLNFQAGNEAQAWLGLVNLIVPFLLYIIYPNCLKLKPTQIYIDCWKAYLFNFRPKLAYNYHTSAINLQKLLGAKIIKWIQ